MRDLAECMTLPLPTIPPPAAETNVASARLKAAHYVAPKQRGSCRQCKHRATNTDRAYCDLFRAPVELGGVCSRVAIR